MVDLLNDKRRPYQCAYRLWQMRMYPEWNEDFWHTHGGVGPHKGEVFNDDDVVFLQDTYMVTKGTYYNKNVIWPLEKVNEDWIGYCQDVLEFKVPEWIHNDQNWEILTAEEKQKLREEREANKKAKIAAAPHIMAAYDVVPDIIDSFDEKIKLSVKYRKEIEVKPEPPMSESQTMEKPSDIDYSATSKEFFSLVMVDPDAPASWNPKARSWRHWVVVNIVSNAVMTGTEISSYVPPGPPTGSGLHRYVFLLFKQPAVISTEKLNDNERGNFDVREFAKNRNLELVGGTLFQVQAAKYK